MEVRRGCQITLDRSSRLVWATMWVRGTTWLLCQGCPVLPWGYFAALSKIGLVWVCSWIFCSCELFIAYQVQVHSHCSVVGSLKFLYCLCACVFQSCVEHSFFSSFSCIPYSQFWLYHSLVLNVRRNVLSLQCRWKVCKSVLCAQVLVLWRWLLFVFLFIRNVWFFSKGFVPPPLLLMYIQCRSGICTSSSLLS